MKKNITQVYICLRLKKINKVVNLLSLFLILILFSCSSQIENKVDNLEEKQKDKIIEEDTISKVEINLENVKSNECETIFLSDYNTKNFRLILENFKYEKVLKTYFKNLEISKEININSFDTTYIDTVLTLTKGKTSFTYYKNTKNQTIKIIQLELVNEHFELLKGFKIGDDYNEFWYNIIMKSFPKQKLILSNCICISTLSGYDEFYFNFKDSKLFSFKYYDNTGMY